MRNAGLEEAQAGIKITRRNIYNLRYTDDTTLMVESEVELKSLLMKVKEETEKAGLKFNIQKTKIMASGPITSRQIEGEKVQAVKDFILGGSKITTNGYYSHEIKRCFLLGKERKSEVAQLCPTLCDPMDCSPPGSSVHGMFHARVLEWGAISFSRGSFQPRD